MTADLEREAREAALDHGEWLEADHDETNYDAYVAGYLAAATAREKEIEELKTQAALLEVERNSMLVVLTDYKRSDREAYAEIASLRAKLEAVPVEEIRAVCEWELGLDFPDTAAISSWLATVTKP